ncbi:13532_t:CDS:1, partial [Cetraspora pellucida]
MNDTKVDKSTIDNAKVDKSTIDDTEVDNFTTETETATLHVGKTFQNWE